ncbi:MAG: phage tail tape measure protein [Opitutaceae bacterium]
MSLELQAVVALNTRPFHGALSGLQSVVANTTGALSVAFGGVTSELLAMQKAFGGIGLAIGVLKQATTAGGGFQQQMANVASVTGIVGPELDRLSKSVREFAVNTRAGAGGAADALLALGQAGLSSSKDLMNVLRPTMLLAGATMSDAKAVGETLASTLINLRMPFSEAGRAADLFSGMLATSPGNMTNLTDAMKFAAPIAGALGMNMNQLVQEIGAFHVAGQVGERAGTAFRQALVQLMQAAEKSGSDVGFALQGWNAGTDGLTGAVRRLTAAGIDTNTLMSELGPRAGTGMAALMNIGADAIEKYGVKLQSMSNVAKMNAVQMDTLPGRLALVKNHFLELSLTLFERIYPALKTVTDALLRFLETAQRWSAPVLTATLRTWRKLMDEARDAIDKLQGKLTGLLDRGTATAKSLASAWAALPGHINGIVFALALLLPALIVIAKLRLALLAINWKKFATDAVGAAKAFMMNFVGPILAGLLLLAAAFVGFTIGQAVREVKIGSRTIGNYFDEWIGWVVVKAEDFQRRLPVIIKIGLLNVQKWFYDLLGNVADWVSKNVFAPMIENTGKFVGKILDTLGFDKAAEKVREALAKVSNEFATFDHESKLTQVNSDLAKLNAELSTLKTRGAADLKNALDQIENAAAEEAKKGTDTFAEFIANIRTKGQENLKALGDVIIDAAGLIRDKLGNIIGNIRDFFGGVGAEAKAAGEAAGDAAQGAAAQVTDAAEQIDQAMNLIGSKTEIAIGISWPANATNKILEQWADFLIALRKANVGKIEIAVAIALPAATKKFLNQWKEFITALSALKTPNLQINISATLPRLTKSAAEIWSGFLGHLKAIGLQKMEVAISVDLPKMTSHQVTIWKQFFDALRGVGNLDLSKIAVDVRASDFKTMAGDIAAIRGFMGKAEGILWA